MTWTTASGGSALCFGIVTVPETLDAVAGLFIKSCLLQATSPINTKKIRGKKTFGFIISPDSLF
jgi:hypothetical protein